MRHLCLSILLLTAPLAASQAGAAVTLVRNGRPAGAIQIPAGAPAEVQEGARELALYLGKISGAEVPVGALAPGEAAGAGVLLGALAEQAGLKVAVTTVSGEAYRVRTQGDRVLIAGETPVAVRHGAYRLLEALGVRWFTPGELGEVVPQRRTVTVPDLDLLEKPDAPYRRFWYGGKGSNGSLDAWNRRNRNAGYRGGSFAHAWKGLVPDKLFAEHPEYFSLRRGERSTKQLCTTNPGTAQVAAGTLIERMRASPETWIFPAGPNDGGGLCECERCRAMDTPDYLEPSSGLPNCSDRILDFANRVAALTSREFPDRLISFLVYSEYSRVPAKVTSIHPNVIPMIAPIRRCRYHGPDNPVCPSSRLLGDEIRGWGKMTRQLGFYPYNYNLADALLPFSKVSAYRDTQRLIKTLDLRNLAWDLECIDAWSIYAPHLYLSARLMWNADIDIDAAMRDFYEGFYGPARGPMRDYWESLDQAYARTPAHAGSFFDAHLVFTPERLARWEATMAEAGRLAPAEPYHTRVAMAAAGLECARRFFRVRDAMNACRWAEAKAEKDALFAHIDAMAKHTEPNWTHDRYSKGYFETFVGRTVEGGAAVMQAGGQVVVRFPDEWSFATDEADAGVAGGWYREEFDDHAWRKLRTYSASWEEQGLGDYKRKPAWHRVRVEVPAGAKVQDLRLWFGGIDESATVWVNGKPAGEGKGFARPFELPVGALLRPGTNLVAVRCLSVGLAELGTGGILRPVMLYRPGGEARPGETGDVTYGK